MEEGMVWLVLATGRVSNAFFRASVPISQLIGVFAGSQADVAEYLTDLYGADANKMILKDITKVAFQVHASYEGIESTPIDRLGLSLRTCNSLKRAKINYLGDLMGKSEGDLRALPCIGPFTAREILTARKSYLNQHGYRANARPKNPIVRYRRGGLADDLESGLNGF